MAGARHAITGKAAVGLEGSATRARHGKRTELQEVARIVFVVNDWPDHIGSIKAAVPTAVVVFEVIVQVKGLTTLQGGGAVDAPSVLQFCHASAHLRESVAGDPHEAMRNVEVRRALFRLWLGAVLGHGGVHNEILAVAGIVEGFRPDIVDQRSEAMIVRYSELGLKRMIVRLPRGIFLEDVN